MNTQRKVYQYLIGSALFLIAGYALAQGGGDTIGKVADNLTATMISFTKLISAGSYVAGISLALVALVKFKAHKDAPTQTALSMPLILLAVATGLIFLPSVINTIGASLFGGNGQQANSQGGGFQ